MIKATRAIVRYPLPDQAQVPVGALVEVSDRVSFTSPGLRFPACVIPGPGDLLWLPGTFLLPLTDYLRRQPPVEFWMLLARQHMNRSDGKMFLNNPYSGCHGPVGFHFESPGEVAYFLRFFGTPPDHYKLVHVTDYPKYQ